MKIFESTDYFNSYCLADGVWVLISRLDSPKTYPGGNSCVIDIGDRTIIFDTFAYLSAAKQLLQFAIKHSSNTSFVVINSHFHFDHVRGNQEFDGLFISSTKTRQLMRHTSIKDVEQNKLEWPKIIEKTQNQLEEAQDQKTAHELMAKIEIFQALVEELDVIEVTLPQISFDRKLVLHGSKRDVELITYGGAHTASDVILYLPDEKIVHGGDLLNNKFHPYLEDGIPENWIGILEVMQELDIQTIIPGHGEIGGKEIIDNVIRYFEMLRDEIPAPEGFFDDYIGSTEEFVKNMKLYNKKQAE